MRKCSACGRVMDPSATICPACGRNLTMGLTQKALIGLVVSGVVIALIVYGFNLFNR